MIIPTGHILLESIVSSNQEQCNSIPNEWIVLSGWEVQSVQLTPANIKVDEWFYVFLCIYKS